VLKLPREVRVGDIIKCQGMEVKIASISSIDYSKTKGYINEVRIEFTDVDGIYRSWVSDVDGGEVILDSENLGLSKALLQSYYSSYTGRYLIPYESANVDNTLAMLCLIENGYAFTSYIDDGEKYYILYSLKEDCKDFQSPSNLRGILDSICSSKGVSPFTRVSLGAYSDNLICQEIIDEVLEKCSPSDCVDGYSIGVISDGDRLILVEVLDACV